MLNVEFIHTHDAQLKTVNIFQMLASCVIPLASPSVLSLSEDGDDFVDLPDTGYAFVYHEDGRQIFTVDNRAVQVPISFADS